MRTKVKRALLREARNLGFRDDGRPSRQLHVLRCIRGSRILHMQIWDDGQHRVSHATYLGQGLERATTRPTPFVDLVSMYRAIAFEWQRASSSAVTA